MALSSGIPMPRSGPARLAPYKRLKSGGRDDSGRISRVPRWRGHKAIPRQQDVVFLVWTGPWLAAEAGALVRSRASRYRRLIVRPYPHRCGGAKSSGSQAHRSCLSGFMPRRGPVRGDPNNDRPAGTQLSSSIVAGMRGQGLPMWVDLGRVRALAGACHSKVSPPWSQRGVITNHRVGGPEARY